MFNRKPILAVAFCLHGVRKHKFPRMCPWTKTYISSSFLKLQAWNLEYRLLTPCGSHINGIQGATFSVCPYTFHCKSMVSLKIKISGWFFFGLSPTISIVLYSPTLFFTFLETSKCFLSNGTNYMHILASGPELQAVYFGLVIQAEIEKKGA